MVLFTRIFLLQAVFVGLFSFSTLYAQEKDNSKTIEILPSSEIQESFGRFDIKGHTIDLETFMAWHSDKNIDTVILDLRSLAEFEVSHIQGAKHLGADIDEKVLSDLVPSKDTRIILYCSNSLYASRMISLTDMSLPQFHMLGYENSYMLGPVWGASGIAPDFFPIVKP